MASLDLSVPNDDPAPSSQQIDRGSSDVASSQSVAASLHPPVEVGCLEGNHCIKDRRYHTLPLGLDMCLCWGPFNHCCCGRSMTRWDLAHAGQSDLCFLPLFLLICSWPTFQTAPDDHGTCSGTCMCCVRVGGARPTSSKQPTHSCRCCGVRVNWN
jgi:hypothetical protein